MRNERTSDLRKRKFATDTCVRNSDESFFLRKVTNVLLLLLRGRYLCSLVASSRRIGFRILIPFRESFALVSCSSVQKISGEKDDNSVGGRKTNLEARGEGFWN